MNIPLAFLFLFLALLGPRPPAARANPSILHRPSLPATRGGGGASRNRRGRDGGDAYALLARSIRTRLNAPPEGGGPASDHGVASASSALRSLSAAQAALKKIDGTAHEVYQRTHKSSTSLDDHDDGTGGGADGEGEGGTGGRIGGLKVAGRMSRNAARVGCIADALFAAELCELIATAPPSRSTATAGAGGDLDDARDEGGTLAPWTGRRVVLKATVVSSVREGLSVSVLVIYEPDYGGGAGIGHGGVDDLLSFAKEEMAEEEDEDDADSRGNPMENAPRGRYLVVLYDHCTSHETASSASTSSFGSDLPSIISILDAPPKKIRLSSRGEDNDGASVCAPLYEIAGELLDVIGPVLLEDRGKPLEETSDRDGSDSDANEERSPGAAGDPQSLPAIHFVGYSLAGGIAAIAANILDGSLPRPNNNGENERRTSHASLSGSARDRTSALCIGPPPCLSANVPSPFVKSIINGDDVVCRTTQGTLDRLCDRVRRSIKGGLLGRSVGWMSEAVSLTVSGLKGGDGGEGRLGVPGNAFLVRPRRIGGGSSSIHEVGGRGPEALRAALLWQLNDVLLSGSLWAHHRLEAYVRSLDRVRLKGFSDGPLTEGPE